MKPITEETTENIARKITLDYENVSEELRGKVILTDDEYRSALDRAYDRGKAVGFEFGYRKGLYEMPPVPKGENAACIECWQSDALVNSDYCADCQPTYICQLCYKPSATGTEHLGCEQKERAYSDYVNEQMAA